MQYFPWSFTNYVFVLSVQLVSAQLLSSSSHHRILLAEITTTLDICFVTSSRETICGFSFFKNYLIFSPVHSHRPLVINVLAFQKDEGSINKNNIRFDTTYLSKRTLQQNCCIQYQTKQCFSKLNLIQSKSDSRNCKMRKIRVLRNIIIHDSVREMTSYLAL